MTEEVAVEAIHLSEIATTKTKKRELEDKIKSLEESVGIPALRDELKLIDKLYDLQLAHAVQNEIFSEDHFQLINKGRVTTVIDAHKAYDMLPHEIFWKVITVGKGKLEEMLHTVYDTQDHGYPTTKKCVEAVVEGISTKQQGQKYELIDLLEGE